VKRFVVSNQEDLDEYFDKYAAPLHADHQKMWEGKVTSTKAIYRVISEQDEEVSE